jgi:hypothetical protein
MSALMFNVAFLKVTILHIKVWGMQAIFVISLSFIFYDTFSNKSSR